MWVVSHRSADDFSNLVEGAVFHQVHRVEHPSLHRLESVLDVRHRTL